MSNTIQNPIQDALELSVIVNRRDKVGQVPWTEWRAGATYSCSANPYSLVMTGAAGTIDPCLLPAIPSSLIEVNGTPVTDQSTLNFIPGTGIVITFGPNGEVTFTNTGASSTSFADITSGTNLTSTMTVSTGAVLTYTLEGVVNANEVGTIDIAGNLPTHPGEILISQPGNTSAVWADPLVQGLYAAGSAINFPPTYTPPTTIQPVLMGAEDANKELQNLVLTPYGSPAENALNVYVVNPTEAQVVFPSSVPVTQSTSPWVVQDPAAESSLAAIELTLAPLTFTDYSATEALNVYVVNPGTPTSNAAPYSVNTGNLIVSVPTTLTPLLSIRPKSGAGSIVFTLTGLDITAMPAISQWTLYKNATLGGGTNWVNVSGTNAQMDVDSTTITGGVAIDSGYTTLGTRANTYEILFGFSGSPAVGDILTIAIDGDVNGNSTHAAAALRWTER
jgi:hypothetical protein